MKIPPNNNINALNVDISKLPNRLDRSTIAKKFGVDLGGSFELEDVHLTLSRRAQSMLTVHEGSIESMIQPFEEFNNIPRFFSESFSNEAVLFLSHISRVQASLGFNLESDPYRLVENEDAYAWLVDNSEIAEIGFHLQNGQAANQNNLIDFANRYLEMRSAFEERYTGEELETRLNQLSSAFDLIADSIGYVEADRLNMALTAERVGIRIHNALLEAGYQSNAFANGKVDFNDDEKRNLTNILADKFREATTHFARMTRQFALENGAITNDSDKAQLANFLQSAERPQGSFTYNDLQTLKEIQRSNWRPGREVTTFTKILQEFNL